MYCLLIFAYITAVHCYYDISECESVCFQKQEQPNVQKLSLLPTEWKSQSSCQRGCRFFFLIYLKKDELTELNNTKEECVTSCKESYVNVQEEGSCVVGCDIVFNQKKVSLPDLISFSRGVNNRDFEILELDESYDGNIIKKLPTSNFEEKVLDWLECASRNSGIPEWLLIAAILVAILSVVLLSFSSDKIEHENASLEGKSDLSLLIEKDSKVIDDKKASLNTEVEFSKSLEQRSKNFGV